MKKKTMEYKAKSSRGFVVVIKRNSDGKVGIYEAGAGMGQSFYFLSDRSAEEVAKRILKEVRNDKGRKAGICPVGTLERP